MTKPQITPPLDTRHVFLDTQVYRKLGYNSANPALRSLAKHVEARTVVLHVTDITLMEIRRHIAEDVESRSRDLATIEKSLRRWRHSAPSLPQLPEIDSAVIADAIFRDFERKILQGLSAVRHNALDVPPSSVFEDYFSRKPPFDKDQSKEFPDAFMLKALSVWCSKNEATMHVVSQDKAMLRAVAAAPRLSAIQSVEEVLARASSQREVDTERVADAVLAAPEIDYYLESALERLSDDLILLYYGDLPAAEIIDHHVGSIEAITDYSLAWVGARSVALILTVETNVAISVQYEDRSLAMYDREDDRWFGADTLIADLDIRLPIELFVEVDLATRQFIMSELMQDEYLVSPSGR